MRFKKYVPRLGKPLRIKEKIDKFEYKTSKFVHGKNYQIKVGEKMTKWEKYLVP